VLHDREEGGREPHDPGDGEQQADAGQHGHGQADLARLGLQGLGQVVGDDDDEDDVVDAKDDLEAGQGQEGDDALRFEHGAALGLRCGCGSCR